MKMTKLPVPTGEYAVGTMTYTVKDDREEVLPAGGMRSIAARVYYPVTKESVRGLPKSEALSLNMIKGFKKVFHIAPDIKRNPEFRFSECYENAERIPDKKFPLIIFNHGYGSYREGNSFLCIELASHGYAVICVTHSYESLCTEFDDGSFVFCDKRVFKRQYEPKLGGLLAMYRLMKAKGSDKELADKFDQAQRKYRKFMMGRLPEWVKDTEAALEYARTHLSDLIDFEKGIGASGHSFGGNTAYALCVRNPDFVCGINMDGGLFGDYTDVIQTKPFMQISCKDNENMAARVCLHHTHTVYKAVFKDMKHMGFADSKFLMPVRSSVGKLDGAVLHENMCRLHLEFFDAYLKGLKEKPLLAGNEAVTVTEYPPDI